MFEYVAFNPYNASPEAMASELTKKSSEGWEVVEILPTFDGRYCAFLRRPVSSSLDSSSVLGSSAVASVPATVAISSSGGSATVPAAWYADPSGRYELRYWNGKEWTEHVARSGQQFTDPPVA
jgi:hypothetical protein